MCVCVCVCLCVWCVCTRICLFSVDVSVSCLPFLSLQPEYFRFESSFHALGSRDISEQDATDEEVRLYSTVCAVCGVLGKMCCILCVLYIVLGMTWGLLSWFRFREMGGSLDTSFQLLAILPEDC